MKSFDVLNLFVKQIERNIVSTDFRTKVVLTPTSLKEAGLIIKVSLLKCYSQTVPKGIKAQRMVRIRLQVAGRIESQKGLEQACAAIEALDNYFGCKTESNETTVVLLEDHDGNSIPNTRIRVSINQEDSFIDTPDSIEVQDLEDDRIIIISFPWEE